MTYHDSPDAGGPPPPLDADLAREVGRRPIHPLTGEPPADTTTDPPGGLADDAAPAADQPTGAPPPN